MGAGGVQLRVRATRKPTTSLWIIVGSIVASPTGGRLTRTISSMAMLLCHIRRVLRDHRALIVHLSGTPRGIGAGQPWPDFPVDLQQVVASANTWEISCSTVSSGHMRAAGDLMGSVGLILRCKRGASLLGVWHQDAGSWYDPKTGRRNLGFCIKPTTKSCTDSINHRHGHNEWVVGCYEAVGLFMDGTLGVWDTATSFERQSNLQQITSAFPRLPVLYYYQSDLWEIHPQQRQRDIDDFN